MPAVTFYDPAVIDDLLDRCRLLFGPDFALRDADRLAEMRQAIHDEEPGAELDLEGWLDPHLERLIDATPQFHDAEISRSLLKVVAAVLLNQLLDGDPAEAWRAAQRMLSSGMAPAEARCALIAVLGAFLTAAAHGEELSSAELAMQYDALPDGMHATVFNAVLDTLEERPGIDLDTLIDLVGERCGAESEGPDGGYAGLVGEVVEELTDRGDGPLLTLPDGRMVFLPAAAAGKAFTHVVTEEELIAEQINATIDLAPLVGHYDLGLDGPIEDAAGAGEAEPSTDRDERRIASFLDSNEDGTSGWVLGGPDGWLATYSTGETIAFRASMKGHLTIQAVPDPEPIAPALVTALRSTFDSDPAHHESGVAVSVLIARMLLADPDVFASPGSPLSALVGAAGLRTYGAYVVETDAQIEAIDRLVARSEIFEAFGPSMGPRVADVMALLDEPTPTRDQLERALVTITAEGALAPLAAQLFLDGGAGIGRSRARTEAESRDHAIAVAGRVERLADQLAEVARNPKGQVAVHVLRARAAEHRGDPIEAEARLAQAQKADRRDPHVIDLVGWYASDRGDWVEAHAALVQFGLDDALTTFVVSLNRTMDRRFPRNGKCFCGSGKKFKACHLGRPEAIPLAERAPWLWMKAVAFLNRSTTFAGPALAEMAGRMLGDDGFALDEPFDLEDVSAVMNDPVTADLLLVEEGWFAQFLAARGPLLPADERALAAEWVPITRSVYDVLAVTDTTTLVRDTIADREIEVAKIRHAKVSDLFVGRVVPDGEGGHLLLGHGVCVHEDNDLAEVQQWVGDHDLDALADLVAGNDRVGV